MFISPPDFEEIPPVNGDSEGENSFISTWRFVCSGSIPLTVCSLLENA
jgi:hypothetical protein